MKLFCVKINYNGKLNNNFSSYISRQIENSNNSSNYLIHNLDLQRITLTYIINDIYSDEKFYNYFQIENNIDLFIIGKIKQRDSKNVDFQRIAALYFKNKASSIINDFVGNYLLLIVDDKKKNVVMIKSPVCNFNCYYMASKGNNDSILISSDLNYFMEYNKDHYLPNDGYIKKYLACYFMRYLNSINTMTPFDNVFIIPNGTMVSPYENDNIKCIWHPNMSYNKKKKHSLRKVANDFKILFRNSITEMVDSVKEGSELCIFLSGGYDSSSIACVLEDILNESEKKISIKYLHYHYTDKGDEIDFAKCLAEKTNRRLIIIEQNSGNVLLNNFLPIKSYIEPNEQILYSDNSSENESLGNIFINGCGGDHLLLSAPESLTGLFSFRNKIKWLNLLINISHSKNISYIETVQRYLISPLKKKTDKKKTCERYLSDMFSDNFTHNYFRNANNVKIPRLYHDTLNQRNFENIYCGSIFPKDDNLSMILFQPFLQQELVEYCLNIPAFFKYDGEDNRIFMKKAMSGLLPSEIMGRNSKSSNERAMSEELKKNWNEISNFFENPITEQLNILKRGSIKKILKQLEMECCLDIPNSIRIITAEVWLREKKGIIA